MKRLFIIFLFGCLFGHTNAQEYHLLRGYVTDTAATPLPGVYVRLASGGTITDGEGKYELRLEEGVHRISFTYVGYKTVRIDQLVDGSTAVNIILREDANQIDAVTVSNKRKDFSYQVIRNAVDAKEKYNNQFVNQKRTIYVKSTENIIRTKVEEKEKEEDQNTIEAVDKKNKDSIPNLHYFEGKFTQYTQPPRGFKQVKEAAKKISNQNTLMYTNTTDADFNFYNNLILVKKLGDNSYISPLSNTTFISYKFKLLGSAFDNGEKYYRIQVKPRKMGNALFAGELHIWDSTWRLKYVNLSLPKRSLIMYDKFRVEQSYGMVNNKWVLLNEDLTWQMKTSSDMTKGNAKVIFTDYSFDSTYAKRFFNAEVGITQDSAYTRDTGYWAAIRPIPLSNEESKFIAYQDSLYRLRHSKVYLDSIDSVFNKITLLNVLLDGQGRINREKKQVWSFDPAISMINPVAIGGFRLRYSVGYNKTFESRKRLYISPLVNYGFRNNDLKGGGQVNVTYNPKKLARASVAYYNDFDVINDFATFQDIFGRKNFYETSTVRLSHSFEVINGLYLYTSLSSDIREPLTSFEFNPAFDSTFSNADNPPLDFETNGSSIIRIGMSYTPKQLYIQEPKEKIVLGSSWPTFSLYYNQAVPGLFNSTTDYKFLELGINQKINLGIFGTSQYNIQIGSFLDTTELLPMDYKYQRGGDPYFFIPPMFGYQLIDSTFPVFEGFFESHYNHEFNGFIMSKIPGLKQLNIRVSGGGGLLYVPERNFQYLELHTGVSRLFRIGKVRFKLGAHYAVSQSNQQGFRSGFKFLITPWNPQNSSWAF